MMYAQRLAHWPTHNKRSVNGSYFYEAPVPRQEARCLPGSVCLCRVETSKKPCPFSCPRVSQTAARTHRPQTVRSSLPRAGMNCSMAQRAPGLGPVPPAGRAPNPGASEAACCPDGRAAGVATSKMAGRACASRRTLACLPGRRPFLHRLPVTSLPRGSGLCSQGLGACLSSVRRANKSAWPTSSCLPVSHSQIKIITRRHTVAGEGGGMKWHPSTRAPAAGAAVAWQPEKVCQSE